MEELKEKAALIRKWSLISTSEASSGHPTSSMSAADIMTVLFDQFLTYDIKNPHNLNNDRVVFSKGHASPLLYSLFAVAGAYPLEKLKSLRKVDSYLEGHPTFRYPYSDIAAGSLGQGLSIGAGLALANKKDGKTNKTYVLLGDGEMAEGNVWEAANFAGYYELSNLIAIVDVNGLGQSQRTMFDHRIEEYVSRLSAFGFEVLAIDGHNLSEIQKAFELAITHKGKKPYALVARTLKGKGVSFLEDKDGWHGKALGKEDLEKALKELGKVDDALRFKLKMPKASPAFAQPSAGKSATHYAIGDQVATREVYGPVLAELGNKDKNIFALDGDTKNSTFSEGFLKVHPERFVECFIAEQNMVAVAVGLSKQGKIPFASTFSAFFTRAADQIRMSALSKANIKFVGSHAGVSIGEDGPSQMGLEDFAMFGAIVDSVVVHPSDAVAAAKLIEEMYRHKGISYMRTLRPKTSVLYSAKEKFKIGGSRVLKESSKDKITVIACGITVHEALKAYEELKKQGINISVIDAYSLKPLDEKTIKKYSAKTKKVITVEDHYEHGGLGDFVLSALADTGVTVTKMAVRELPRSATKDELLDMMKISSKHIVKKVKSLI